jgi:hypothetical protein
MAGDETVYHPLTPTTRRLMVLAPLILLAMLVWSAAESGADLWAALERFGPSLAVGSLIGVTIYRMAHTIILYDTTSTLEFRTFIGSRVVSARDITSVSPSFFQSGQLVIKHANGSVTMLAQFDGCHDLLEWIRKRNPAVILKGI